MPAHPLPHDRQHRLDDIHVGEEVGLELVAHERQRTRRLGQLLDRADEGLAGAAEEDVDAAEGFDGFGDGGLALADDSGGEWCQRGFDA